MHVYCQAPQQAKDRAIWKSAKAIMEASAQKFNLTDLSTRRDMSMLLAQSAVQVGLIHPVPCWCQICKESASCLLLSRPTFMQHRYAGAVVHQALPSCHLKVLDRSQFQSNKEQAAVLFLGQGMHAKRLHLTGCRCAMHAPTHLDPIARACLWGCCVMRSLPCQSSPQPWCALQPGVASVYCSIVQQTRSGVEFYIKAFPELEGLSYRAARRSFDKAVICGYQQADGTLRVNPKDGAELGSGDRMIALAQTGTLT